MKFSIIIPIYKVQAYLEQCIESVLHQNYKDIEVILVDDGSPDECPAMCDRYAKSDSRIKVIHKENGGLVSARKAGAEAAEGAYICCIDGDDYIHPDYIKKMAEEIKKSKCDIVCCNYYLATEKECLPRIMKFEAGYYDRARIEKEIFPYLLQSKDAQYFLPSVCAKAFRREMYRDIQLKIDPVITLGEDRAVSIPCIYRSSSICILCDCLYYYRFNTQSITKSRKAFSWLVLEVFLRYIQKEIDLSKFDFQDQYNRLVAHEFFNVAKSQFYRNEEYKKICQEIIDNLKAPFFSVPIHKAKFQGQLKAKFMESVLKRTWILPIWIYSKI